MNITLHCKQCEADTLHEVKRTPSPFAKFFMKLANPFAKEEIVHTTTQACYVCNYSVETTK